MKSILHWPLLAILSLNLLPLTTATAAKSQFGKDHPFTLNELPPGQLKQDLQRLHDLLHRGVGVALPVEQHLGRLEDALALLVRARGARLLAPARLHRRGAQRGGCSAWCTWCRFGYTHG